MFFNLTNSIAIKRRIGYEKMIGITKSVAKAFSGELVFHVENEQDQRFTS